MWKNTLIQIKDLSVSHGHTLRARKARRFGKSINAYMLGAYFTKGYDSHELFDHLLIAKTDTYEKHLNKQALPTHGVMLSILILVKCQMNVIHIKNM